MNTNVQTNLQVLDFIPQRPPFVQISNLIAVDDTKTTTTFTILQDNILCEEGSFSENGMIENIAQTAAAGFGYLDSLNNKDVALGFIASIKDIEIFEIAKVGDTIQTETEVVNQIMDFKIIKGKIYLNERVIAVCEMRIFVKP